MKIQYLDIAEYNEIIFDNEQKYIINKPKSITIIFQSTEARTTSPFSVKISNALSSINIVIITIIIFVSFLVLILFILFIIYILKRQARHMQNMPIIINNNRNFIIDINNVGFNSERNGLMNYFRCLKPIKFKDIKEKSINNICPIEMTPFDGNSDVIFTSCHHSFHYECLKQHITKNIDLKEFKCFLCNALLYKYNESLNSIVNLNS